MEIDLNNNCSDQGSLHDHDYVKVRKHLVLKGNRVAQQMMSNAFLFFKTKFPQLNTVEVTGECLGISQPTVELYKDGPTEMSIQPQTRKRSSPLTNDLPEDQEKEIAHVIYDMYAQKIPVSLSSLKIELKNRILYSGSTSSLFRVLKKIGFSYKKDDPRRALMETPNIVHRRTCFLKLYMENENLGVFKRPYVFVDETWIFANGTARKSWQNDNIKSVKRVTGDGSRYIVLHAGTAKGFIQGASLIFKSGRSTGDYHGEMNALNFEQWLENQLLPALEEPSIIIMDNASYHSRQIDKMPTKSSKKEVMQIYLKEQNMGYPESATKDVLWNIISALPVPKTSYAVDSLIHKGGHELLRLPPYHCQFNAIEMVWSQAKRFYDKEVLKNKDVLRTWERALESVTASQWENYVKHTDTVIKAAWENDKKLSSDIQPLIINFETDDDNIFQDIESD